jgi:hypothetical protein
MIELKSSYNQHTKYDEFVTKPAPKPQTEPRAYCTSQACNNKHVNSQYNRLGVQKQASRHAVDCPDCSSALFWTTDLHLHGHK